MAVAAGLLALASTMAGCRRTVSSPGSPSIVFILTDDQRWDTMAAMPIVRSELAAHGVTFANDFVSDSLCCPSRITILTGRYAHSTGIWQNKGPLSGAEAFGPGKDRSTIATWLQAAGYRTGLFGKYVNRYDSTRVPPGWNRWVTFAGAKDPYNLYYGYTLSVDGRLERHGNKAQDYSTNVLADQTVDFIRSTPGSLFVYFAPYAPHTPDLPAPGDAGAFSALPPLRTPNYDEADVSDKPGYMRRLTPMSPDKVARIDRMRRNAFASLLSVDRAVGRIVDALQATGRLHDTMIVFTSDNAFLYGEHRYNDKIVPYEESIHVPLVIRWDQAVREPRTDDHMIVNTDFAPTFAAFAGVGAPGVEGRSLLPLLRGVSPPWRSDFVIEGMRLLGVPTFCGIRTTRYKYLLYQTGEEELYDLERDPFELTNLAARPAFSSLLGELRARERQACVPYPPTSGGAGASGE